MKKLFVDTNVVIDLLDKRDGFYIPAVKLFTLAYKQEVVLYISPLTYATASYILRKHPKGELRKLLSNLRELSHVAFIDEQVVDEALTSGFDDFEDALQYFSAIKENVDVIITRNVKDFSLSKLPVVTPDEFLRK
ncbi:PIN domain-containing protein [Phocaeicola salanitronis]|uniref:type II toxin-antitoxin system VapC family toxin n=1 Tax=Phocaeicola salanitronis TaxID=376805 RepID=UPI0023F8E526|nr:PIN domain-containing protein [Phocaeicola salanitronis]